MSIPEREAVELFLQEASEHLQYLREYVSVLQEIEPRREDLERLYIAAGHRPALRASRRRAQKRRRHKQQKSQPEHGFS